MGASPMQFAAPAAGRRKCTGEAPVPRWSIHVHELVRAQQDVAVRLPAVGVSRDKRLANLNFLRVRRTAEERAIQPVDLRRGIAGRFLFDARGELFRAL